MTVSTLVFSSNRSVNMRHLLSTYRSDDLAWLVFIIHLNTEAGIAAPAVTAGFHGSKAALLQPVNIIIAPFPVLGTAAADGFQLIEGKLLSVLSPFAGDLLPKKSGFLLRDLLTVGFYQRGRFLLALRGKELCFQFVCDVKHNNSPFSASRACSAVRFFNRRLNSC